MLRRWLSLAPLTLLACSYPEFAFTPPPDTAIAEAAADTHVPDDDVDSGFDDTTIDDTGVAETREQVDSTMAVDAPPEAMADTVPDTKPDTSPPPDTKMDAPVDAPVLRGCALPHDFCANFDTAAMPADGWTNSFGTSTGSFTLDKTKFTSPSTSLAASVTTSTETASSMVAKHFTVASATTVITAEADIMLDAVTYANPNEIILLKIQRGSAGDGVSFVVGSGGPRLTISGAGYDGWGVPGLVAGKWFHIRIEAVLHMTAGVARLWIDGAPVHNRTGLSTALENDTTRQMVVGVFSYLGSVPFKARFDDVSYDLP